MHFWARHGWHEEEQLTGAQFRVDVELERSVSTAGKSDDLEQTLNYETVFELVRLEMRQPRRLLEKLAEEIMLRIFLHYDKKVHLTLRLSRLHPNLGGKVEEAWVSVSSRNPALGTIGLKGMGFQAPHGFYAEEQIVGNAFAIDLEVQIAMGAAALANRAEDLVSFQTLYESVALCMQRPVKLLERLLTLIMDRLMYQLSNLQAIEVSVRKLSPNMEGKIEEVSVSDGRQFVRNCPRCGSPFIDYLTDDCWCKKESVNSVARKILKERFGNCICPQCIREFGN